MSIAPLQLSQPSFSQAVAPSGGRFYQVMVRVKEVFADWFLAAKAIAVLILNFFMAKPPQEVAKIIEPASLIPEPVPEPAPQQPVPSRVGTLARRTTSALGIGLLSGVVARFLGLPSARSVLPDSVVHLSNTWLHKPLEAVAMPLIEQLTRNHRLTWATLSVICVTEDMMFSFFIQSLLLSKIPKLVLQKIAPAYEHLVDCKTAKAARMGVTSVLFALSHLEQWGHTRGMMLCQLFVGLYFARLREQGASLVEISAVHFFYDAFLLTLGGLLNPI